MSPLRLVTPRATTVPAPAPVKFSVADVTTTEGSLGSGEAGLIVPAPWLNVDPNPKVSIPVPPEFVITPPARFVTVTSAPDVTITPSPIVTDPLFSHVDPSTGGPAGSSPPYCVGGF